MNRKQQKALEEIFADPVRANLCWSDIEVLLADLDAEMSEGNGSRVRVYLSGVRAVFHHPHPEKETDKGAVKSVRRFLLEAAIQKGIEENDL